MEGRVWKNLTESGILDRILKASAHADEAIKYDRVEFYGEPDGKGGFWVKPQIKHNREGLQPVVPKLSRLEASDAGQQRLAAEIWQGVTPEELALIAKYCFQAYYERDQKEWLNLDQSASVKHLAPAMHSGKIQIKIIPSLAELEITSIER